VLSGQRKKTKAWKNLVLIGVSGSLLMSCIEIVNQWKKIFWQKQADVSLVSKRKNSVKPSLAARVEAIPPCLEKMMATK
jgi:hypothetical protein